MAGASEARTSHLFVILNPKSGTSSADAVRQALGRHFSCEDGPCNVHLISGHEKLADLARAAANRGCEIVVAAGGDGTVAGVADGLVGTDTPLGIIPLGTANVLARELGVPVGLEAACALLAGPHRTASIDAMEVQGRHYFTQVGVGLDALMIRDTRTEHKRRFGRAAYLWTAFTRLVGFQPRRFLLRVDGREVRAKASQVLLANSGTLGQPPLRWGPGIRPDDSRIDVCIVRARNAWHYLRLAWNVLRGRHKADPSVRYHVAERSVAIGTKRPLPVQADGEIIGQTPIAAKVVPGAVRVVVPPAP
jgi:diacylglycerol kinase (ATP)